VPGAAIVGDTPWMDAALLQAAGIETVVLGPGGALEKMLFVAGGALVLFGLVVLAGHDGLRGAYVASALAHKPGFTPEAANAAFAAFVGEVPRAVFCGLVVVVAYSIFVRVRMSEKATTTLGGGSSL